MILVSSKRTMARATPVKDDGLTLPSCMRRRIQMDYRAAVPPKPRKTPMQQIDAILARTAAKYPPPMVPSSQKIIKEIALKHGVSVHDIKGRSRKRKIVAARFEAVAAVEEKYRLAGFDLSLPALGRIFGGRDHTTMIYALKKAGNRA